ncbi:MAG: hypothetical protein AAB875_07380, partial [Patescibacteria group bacterium]
RAKTEGKGLFRLNQGYEEGWKAFEFRDGDLFTFEHVLVNSWANGFLVPDGSHEVIIVFLPQYLEFLGFSLGFICFSWMLLTKGADKF